MSRTMRHIPVLAFVLALEVGALTTAFISEPFSRRWLVALGIAVLVMGSRR